MFDDRFEVFLADSAEGQRQHFRLRYRIYCEERGFEEAADFPEGEEMDAADACASHFLVRDRDSGEWVATMRLVLPLGQVFPVETVCRLCDLPADVVRDRTCEISRVGVLRGRGKGPGAVAGRIPEIMFGLFRAAYVHCITLGMEHCLWLSTPAMVRLLKRYDLPMQAIADPCQFHGLRQPHVIQVEEFWRAVTWATLPLDPAFAGGTGYLPLSASTAKDPRLPRDVFSPYPEAVLDFPGLQPLAVPTGTGS